VAEVEGIRYLGNGTQFIEGIPARDLTPEEWAALPEALQRRAAALYAVPVLPAPDPTLPPLVNSVGFANQVVAERDNTSEE
jgi:hypothetical protein